MRKYVQNEEMKYIKKIDGNVFRWKGFQLGGKVSN